MEPEIIYLSKNGEQMAIVTIEPSGLDHFVFLENAPRELCEEVIALRKTISEPDVVKRKTAFHHVYEKSGFEVSEFVDSV